jgi:hypothetical protein
VDFSVVVFFGIFSAGSIIVKKDFGRPEFGFVPLMRCGRDAELSPS